MDTAARISIITPSLNQAPFLSRTIDSVLSQKVEGLEYVVIDGGSTDGTREILERCGGQVDWVSEPDKGQSHAVNKGIRRTNAPIVGWLNSDDVYAPGALATVLEAFEQDSEADIIYGRANHIDAEGNIIEAYPTEPWRADVLLETCFLCQPAAFVRRRVFETIGLLDESLNYCMDYEYWIRASDAGLVVRHIPDLLAGSRVHGLTKTFGQPVKVHDEICRMFARRGSVPGRWLIGWGMSQAYNRGFRRDHWRTFIPATLRFSSQAARRFNGSAGWPWVRTAAHWIWKNARSYWQLQLRHLRGESVRQDADLREIC
ncbi:MAG: glycosyltransferase family 2 protein [Phycisphaerae bacterium]